MLQPHKSKALLGTKKALGQIKKVHALIEQEAYCMDIIQQIRAVGGLLESVSAQMLDNHLRTCGEHAFQSRDRKQQEKLIQEIVFAFRKAQGK